MNMNRAFLTVQWRYLAMLNYTIDPALRQPLAPPGTELDFFDNTTYVSIVGFRFLRTRIYGLGIPWHRDFEEVNLRFYVRRRTADGWRRGVAFVGELVPRRAIAFAARKLYGEPYTALPMGHRIEHTTSLIHVDYRWKRYGKWESLGVLGRGEPQPLVAGSHEEFIAEHYWGYTARQGGCSEYQVEHPPWRIWPGTESYLHADVLALYGEMFVEALSVRPVSTFIAEGSAVTVRCKSDIACPAETKNR
ncbi:MAG: YqjF family protein [Thermoguttaceae bacterium]